MVTEASIKETENSPLFKELILTDAGSGNNKSCKSENNDPEDVGRGPHKTCIWPKCDEPVVNELTEGKKAEYCRDHFHLIRKGEKYFYNAIRSRRRNKNPSRYYFYFNSKEDILHILQQAFPGPEKLYTVLEAPVSKIFSTTKAQNIIYSGDYSSAYAHIRKVASKPHPEPKNRKANLSETTKPIKQKHKTHAETAIIKLIRGLSGTDTATKLTVDDISLMLLILEE